MHRLAPLLVLLLAAGTAWGQQEELTPCYTCRTSECPSLDAPPCPKPRKRSSEEEKAEQEKKAREKAAREKAEQERAAREKAEQERAAREKAEQEKAEQERAAQEQERAAKEQAEKGRAAQERLRQEQLAQARSEQAAKEQARRAALRRGKWGALTAGLLLSGAGATLLALDNRFGRECWMPGDTSTCGETLRLHYGGAPLVAVGGAALVGAIVLFAVDARRGQPEKGARSARLTGTRGLLW